MDLPDELNAKGELELMLPSGRTVTLPRAQPILPAGPPHSSAGALASSARAPAPAVAPATPAAAATLRLLRESGWEGVWIDHAAGCFRPDPSAEPVGLPAEAEGLLERTRADKGGGAIPKGSWDLLCWRPGRALFVALKRRDRDRFTGAELAWVESAFMNGFEHDSFLVVEWSPDRE